jgi:hypothetical protein
MAIPHRPRGPASSNGRDDYEHARATRAPSRPDEDVWPDRAGSTNRRSAPLGGWMVCRRPPGRRHGMSRDPIFWFPCLRNVAEDPKRASSLRYLSKQTANLELRPNAAGIAPQPDGQASAVGPPSFRCCRCLSPSVGFRQRASNPRFARLSPPYPPLGSGDWRHLKLRTPGCSPVPAAYRATSYWRPGLGPRTGRCVHGSDRRSTTQPKRATIKG